MSKDARREAETAARIAYGRLLASLITWSRDITGAEDALADAFLAALQTWPERGVPSDPEAWLVTAARNKLRRVFRHNGVISASLVELAERFAATECNLESSSFPDDRLKLLFVCAHPAIEQNIRAPLMMQAVLGIDSERIARAFLVAPSTMAQRLVRAKAKIRDARLRYEVPDARELPGRLDAVLNAIYAAYGLGWDAVGVEGDPRTAELAAEAIYLARLLVKLLPDAPEGLGLLALMLFCEARRLARRDENGSFVSLARQDVSLWSRPMILEAEELITRASCYRIFGRFQCEAAIQSVHVQRAVTGMLNYEALKTLYDLLAAHYPEISVQVARAAVYLEAGESQEAERLLLALGETAQNYQPFWVTGAHVAAALNRGAEARLRLSRALALTASPSVRSFLSEASHSWRDDEDPHR